MAAPVLIREFTDPGCPWAWNAEPVRARLDWLYGDRIEWHVRPVVLSEEPKLPEDGWDWDRFAGHLRHITRLHGMPIDMRPRERGAATIHACRAVAATKVHKPECTRRVLRRLRVRAWKGALLDDPETIEASAADAGISAAELAAWTSDPLVEEHLRRDMAEARAPLPAARALDHKLANWSGGRRYTCPSYEIERVEDGVKIAIPGFQPPAVYEVVLANLVPGVDRCREPGSPLEVLEWSGIPMATAEVAKVCDTEPDLVREQLAGAARFEAVGADGFWSLL